MKGSLHRGNKDEMLDCIAPADHAHQTAAVLDGSVLIQNFRPGSVVAISQTHKFRFTPKRQWSMRVGYFLNKIILSAAFLHADLNKQEYLLSWPKF